MGRRPGGFVQPTGGKTGQRRTDQDPENAPYVWARESETRLRVRFFFSKHGGVVEDPGTGSACANLGGWFIASNALLPISLSIAQGDQVGRPCRIGLRVDEQQRIFVSGRVIELGRGDISM